MLALLAAASLGSAHFVATGPPDCRRRMLEGVLDLHSFMYEDAREAFLQAQKAAPCRDVKRAMEAAAIAQDVFGRNPDHPGAAHYLIHACDSPEHAVLALKAARRYAQIAPAAGHALHMPSHIFVQLGMWSEVESSNLASFAASKAWVARRKLPASRTDWHSYLWLAAARLRLGTPAAVLPMIARLRDLALREKDAEVRWAHAQLAAVWIEATREWPRAEEMLALPPLAAEDEPGYVDTQLQYEGPSHNPYGLLSRAVAARVPLHVAARARVGVLA